MGKLVPVSAISVTLADPGLPDDGHVALPDHLEEIVLGSHPSLGESGRQLRRELLYRYIHVFPALGEPVTGRTTSVQHEILMSDARPVRCGPRRRPVFGRNRHVFKKCYSGVRLSPVRARGIPR